MRETFDKHHLISALHSFMSVEDKKYKNLLPPLVLLSQEKQKELLIKYCSKDTLAVYYLVKYLMEKTKT